MVSPYLKQKYEKEASKFWDIFYKRNSNKFFKDRHYLFNEWGPYLGGELDVKKCLLEVGCGAGNTIYPLLQQEASLFIHACDFSSRAVALVKAHEEYNEERINAFVCNITADKLTLNVPPSSVDIVTMIFVLSAISFEKMSDALENVTTVLKPGAHVLFRDYAVGDLAQERLVGKIQQIDDNFFVRGDGTRVYYFSEEVLRNLFSSHGFEAVDVRLHCRDIENRGKKMVMKRRWIQGTFKFVNREAVVKNLVSVAIDRDLSTSPKVEAEELALVPSALFLEEMEFEVRCLQVGQHTVRVKSLRGEYQHVQQDTGLLLWDSALSLAGLVNAFPLLVHSRNVLEVGCGSNALGSLLASINGASRIIATDGSQAAMELLVENMELNKCDFPVQDIELKVLPWGTQSSEAEVEGLVPGGKFDVILGADVVYVSDAVSKLFATSKRLLAPSRGGSRGVLLLCHVTRRVCEDDIVEYARTCGLKLCNIDYPELERFIANFSSTLRLLCFTHEMD